MEFIGIILQNQTKNCYPLLIVLNLLDISAKVNEKVLQ